MEGELWNEIIIFNDGTPFNYLNYACNVYTKEDQDMTKEQKKILVMELTYKIM